MIQLRDLMAQGNFLGNQDTGAMYDLGPSQQAGPAVDYSMAPVEIPGYGKGYRLKGDPLSAVLADGRIVRFGEDTGAARKMDLAQMQMQKQRQELETGNIEQQTKRAELAELIGIAPAAQAGGFSGGAMPSMPTQQASVMNQKMLSRRFGNPPSGHRWDAQGNAIPIPGVEKPLTEFQGKSAGYGARVAVAHEVLNSIGQDGKVQPGIIKRVLESTPLVGDGLGTLANVTQSPEQQQVEQSQRDFVNAVLRQESGAAISEGEFNNAKKQYFPQPGDTPEVIAQKARNREQAIAGFSTSAGNDGVKLIRNSREAAQTLFEAKKAIAKGADREKVKQRLEAMGINHSGI